ncbi:Uncharacterised protein [uncultured Comamonas sp.]|nr:Uncharacterised protein [uncultured Comamonas sp.]
MSAAMPWFRMYVDFLNDPKMIALAFEDQRHFIGLLALKSDGALDGDIDPVLLDRIVAQRLWIDHAVIREVKRRLVAAGLICESWQPLAWDKRQMKSDKDNTAAERQRRYRASKKVADETCNEWPDGDVTEASRVTSRARHENVTRLDTDTDTEKERVVNELPFVGNAVTQQAPPAAAPALTAGSACATPKRKTTSSAGTGTRLPDGWQLPKSWGDWALEQRPDMTPADVRREADCFADYWHAVPGAKGRKADWLGTWRNWIRRSDGAAPSLRGGRGGPANPNKYAGAARAIFEGIEV